MQENSPKSWALKAADALIHLDGSESLRVKRDKLAASGNKEDAVDLILEIERTITRLSNESFHNLSLLRRKP